MLYQIVTLLLQVIVGLVAGACLLRLYLQYRRIPLAARSGNPLGPFIFSLTDWLVLPLRRMVRPIGNWDSASLIAAYLLEILHYTLLWLIVGAHGGLASIPVVAVLGLLHLALSGATGLVIVYAVLSWVPGNSAITEVVARMVAPWLKPIRRHIPLFGGVDLSPLVLLVLLQVASIVLGNLQAGVFG